ncbi:MAG: hypothetical protein PHJ00_08050 [Candidatus Omnitrophica bacterium]|jgi:hypothetical protein|nr:hypothetical protein [Candidatus Omnitrophota bacterium]
MKVIVAAVADHAWVENGCLSVSRTFDGINADKFPYILQRMSVALRVLIPRSEAGEHKLRFSLSDSDGKKLMNSEMNINFSPPQGSVPESSFSFALNGQNVVFPKAGDYAVDIFIDGRIEASIPIYAREMAVPPNIPGRA